jgi:Uncharacterized protein conserved in bacteria (DUF2188)
MGASRKTTHVVPSPGGGWNIKQGGAERASRHLELKQDAIYRAREISRNLGSELIIHNRDGKISQCDSHGPDPHPPLDKN